MNLVSRDFTTKSCTVAGFFYFPEPPQFTHTAFFSLDICLWVTNKKTRHLAGTERRETNKTEKGLLFFGFVHPKQQGREQNQVGNGSRHQRDRGEPAKGLRAAKTTEAKDHKAGN